MTLSIASSAAGHGKPFGYGPAGLTTYASLAGGAKRSGAAAIWSSTPPSAEAGRRDGRLSGLLAVLSRFTADATATDRASRLGDDASGSTSGSTARSDAADLLQALNDAGGAPALPARLSSQQSAPEQDPRAVQLIAQRPATDAVSALRIGLPTQDGPLGPSISAADAQLQALFKTLQAYGL